MQGVSSVRNGIRSILMIFNNMAFLDWLCSLKVRRTVDVFGDHFMEYDSGMFGCLVEGDQR